MYNSSNLEPKIPGKKIFKKLNFARKSGFLMLRAIFVNNLSYKQTIKGFIVQLEELLKIYFTMTRYRIIMS